MATIAQNGLFPKDGRTGQPTALAQRVFDQFAVLKAYCETNTLPIKYRDAATFAGDFFKSHEAYFGTLVRTMDGKAPTYSEGGGDPLLTLELVSEPLGLARGNIRVKNQFGQIVSEPA